MSKLLDAPRLASRDKAILAGLYLSKFNSNGLRRLGFDGFTEAFNVIGAALGARPASLKNYRDEFDPLFPNQRKGWHKRPIRDYCKAVYDTFGALNLEDFTKLLKQVIYKKHDLDVKRDMEVGHLFFDHRDNLRHVDLRYAHGSSMERFFEKWLAEYPDPYPQRYRKNIPFQWVKKNGILIMTLTHGEVTFPKTTKPATQS